MLEVVQVADAGARSRSPASDCTSFQLSLTHDAAHRISEAQILSVEAWIELSEGNHELAIAHQTSAADLEDKIGKSPVTPGHVLPARELLGDMLVELGRTEEATEAYQMTLRLSPNRARSLMAIN